MGKTRETTPNRLRSWCSEGLDQQATPMKSDQEHMPVFLFTEIMSRFTIQPAPGATAAVAKYDAECGGRECWSVSDIGLQSRLARLDDSCGAIRNVQLTENIADVIPRRFGTDHQGLCNRRVVHSPRNEP